jgi:hypothetical protein
MFGATPLIVSPVLCPDQPALGSALGAGVAASAAPPDNDELQRLTVVSNCPCCKNILVGFTLEVRREDVPFAQTIHEYEGVVQDVVGKLRRLVDQGKARRLPDKDALFVSCDRKKLTESRFQHGFTY